MLLDIKLNSKREMNGMKETKGGEENSWISCKSKNGEVTLNLYVMKTKKRFITAN